MIHGSDLDLVIGAGRCEGNTPCCCSDEHFRTAMSRRLVRGIWSRLHLLGKGCGCPGRGWLPRRWRAVVKRWKQFRICLLYTSD
ncbi:hypothetical protein FA175_29230, partial [Pseudomonas aeruginosa]|nr:hypothetical protein [Pseudomonas aeruginosa]